MKTLLLILLFPAVLLAQWDFPTNPIVVDSTTITIDSVCNAGDTLKCWITEPYHNGTLAYCERTYRFHHWVYNATLPVSQQGLTWKDLDYYTFYIPGTKYPAKQHIYRICKVCRRKELITFNIFWHRQEDEYKQLDKEIK